MINIFARMWNDGCNFRDLTNVIEPKHFQYYFLGHF